MLSTLQSFAASDLAQDVVLGPKSWTCHQPFGPESALAVYDPAVMSDIAATVGDAPIVVENGFLFGDPVAAQLACTVFDVQSVMSAVTTGTMNCLSERTPRRTVTPVDSRVATFVDANGDRGVGWLQLPSSANADDGTVSVLTCRPEKGLSVAICDTIIADFIARMDAETPPTTTTTGPSTATTSTSTSTTTTTRPATIPTVVCPVTYALTDHTTAHPSTAPRTPSAGDPALFSQLASYAATEDPRFVALGPPAWSCEGQMGADGDNALVIYQTAGPGGAAPDIFTAPIAIENDWLWHGLSAIGNLCKVSTDPAVIAKAAEVSWPCAVPAGRTLTPVDADSSTFVDADGARGGAWFVLPSSAAVDDGKLSILTCRPTTDLTAAECDTIIADWLARNDTTR